MFMLVGRNKSPERKISRDTGFHSEFTTSQLEKLKAAYDKCDLNKDGKLANEEIALLFNRFGISLDSDHLKTLKNPLPFVSFVKAMEEDAKHRRLEQFNLLKQAFTKLDSNKDGYLTARELSQLIHRNVDDSLTDKDLLDYIKLFDKSQDGRINFTEFIDMMLTAHNNIA